MLEKTIGAQVMAQHKSYSDADKAALESLRNELESKLGRKPTLTEMVCAVTPGMPDQPQLYAKAA